MADGKAALIIGGGLLGVLALLAWASPGQSAIQINQPPRPPPTPPGPSPEGTDAAVAAAIAAAQAAFANIPVPASPGSTVDPGPQMQPSGMLLPNPAPLRQGARYRSRLELGALEAGLATPERIRSQFESLGFSNVVVYTMLNQVPPGWPPQALANATGRSRWVEGTWSQPSQSIAKPPQIQNAWTA